MKSGYLAFALIFFIFAAFFSSSDAETFGVKKRRPKPHEFGNVVINNYSYMEGMAPVVFKHWLHRSKFSCRLCHVDLGFAMTAGETGVTCNDIQNGLYCGTCHNGEDSFARMEKKTLGGEVRNCERCHSLGKNVKFKYGFYDFRKTLPKERFGNGIDWLTAEEQKLVTLKDHIEGISLERKKLKDPEDMQLAASELGMPDIVFSHEKHAVWSGCELCHPEIFGVNKGATVYKMQDIFDGKFCGACHGKVAFPNYDCQRCHTKVVY